MADKPDDGGAAYPQSYKGDDEPHEGIGGGMSLRDYFAGQALAGFCAHGINGQPVRGDKTAVTAWAYRYADAMIAAKKEETL